MNNLNILNLINKKYIIFDMDGTLIDSIGVWNETDYRLIRKFSGKEVDLTTIQKERDKFLKEHISSDIYLEYCAFLIKKYNMKITKESLIELRWNISGEILENEMDFKPYSVEVIKKLKEMGFILVLATATTKVQIDIYSKKNKKMLKQLNILDYFDLIIKKENVKNKKPHPEIYLYILNYYDALPEECLVFEDSLHGITAAKEAGIETINVYDKHSDIDRTKINELTDYKIDSYKEFLEILIHKKKLERKHL